MTNEIRKWCRACQRNHSIRSFQIRSEGRTLELAICRVENDKARKREVDATEERKTWKTYGVTRSGR